MQFFINIRNYLCLRSRFLLLNKTLKFTFLFGLYEFGPVACPDSELTSELMSLLDAQYNLLDRGWHIAKPLPTQDGTGQYKHGRTSVPRVSFELTVPLPERSKIMQLTQRGHCVLIYLFYYIIISVNVCRG